MNRFNDNNNNNNAVFHASGSQSEECIVDGSRDHRTPSRPSAVKDGVNGIGRIVQNRPDQKPVNQ